MSGLRVSTCQKKGDGLPSFVAVLSSSVGSFVHAQGTESVSSLLVEKLDDSGHPKRIFDLTCGN